MKEILTEALPEKDALEAMEMFMEYVQSETMEQKCEATV